MVFGTVLVGVAAFVVGCLVGWLFTRQEVKQAQELEVPAPLEDAEFEQQRKFLIERYLESMRQYDRLVPWGSGGALLMSITILEKITTNPIPATRWILALGWGALFLSLVSSIVSHYVSSRIFSSRRYMLDTAQQPEIGDRTLKYLRHQKIVSSAGLWTMILNLVAGGGLLLGIAMLGVFAFLNL